MEKLDVLLPFSNGLHPRTSVPEVQSILGSELFHAFYPTGQFICHDSEDYEHLVDPEYTAPLRPDFRGREKRLTAPSALPYADKAAARQGMGTVAVHDQMKSAVSTMPKWW